MHEILESISQRINGTEVEENRRIYEFANEFSRRCRICECELRESEKHVSEIDIERLVAERYAKEIGCWKTGIIVEELKPVNPKKV